MLTYELTGPSVGDVRFGMSPLTELTLSLRTFVDPSRYPLQLPWVRRTASARQSLDRRALAGLVDRRLWTPDFLNPRPSSPLTRIEDEFDALARIDAAAFRAGLKSVHGMVPPVYRGPHAAAVERMVAALRDLWEACFVPYWDRMRAVLEADIVHRGRVIVTEGLGTMVAQLSPGRITWSGSAVHVALRDPRDRRVEVGAEGLMLVPTLFSTGASAPVDDDGPPQVLYPARGQAALWEAQPRRGHRELVDLLGAPRAGLLALLSEPASSTELGIRLGITASAVNQHLRVLHRAGLLSKARHGRSVLYLRSELGERLAVESDW
ncbi:transcriptional regulator [Aeromicrobium camelliae]|uniref:Transcriptional regulator n=1 Tax=Aeromicrobium camelliae TaxID=1538144 RepID=A0A3N6X8U8_9ACTN|nr:helix-turn-helix domain-containing protein [Aeromicrobium camelliae]RQN10073.1 transcriptional regulator [Aeromicrobium camelliae]